MTQRPFSAQRRPASRRSAPQCLPRAGRFGVFLVVFCTAGLSFVGCKGGVVHPPPDQPNTPEYCAKRPPEEDNCNGCTSQPGCGWCNEPVGSAASCQAGTQAMPATCQAGWAQSTEECEVPPPPPPME